MSLHIVAITGSLRGASSNTGLLRAAKAMFEAKGHTFDLFVPSSLPLLNQDLLSSPLPPAVQEWRERASKADAFLISSCEYNFSLSAALKNAIDWGSLGIPPLGNVFNDKPGAVISTGGGGGGLRAVQHLRDIALFLNLHLMTTNQLNIKLFDGSNPFDSTTGDLLSDEHRVKLEGVVDALIVWANRLNGPSKS